MRLLLLDIFVLYLIGRVFKTNPGGPRELSNYLNLGYVLKVFGILPTYSTWHLFGVMGGEYCVYGIFGLLFYYLKVRRFYVIATQ